jgi:hypothetical protein
MTCSCVEALIKSLEGPMSLGLGPGAFIDQIANSIVHHWNIDKVKARSMAKVITLEADKKYGVSL